MITPEIYQKLLKAVEALPKEAIERTKKEDTRKGYDTTGYQYQYLVNVLNDVVTPSGWSIDYTVDRVFEGKTSKGQDSYDVTVDLELDILGNKKKCAGGHRSTSYGDAKKGAITNALKKTLALYGIGKKAYEGTIDDDYKPLPDAKNNPVKYEAKKTVATQENQAVLKTKKIIKDLADTLNPILSTEDDYNKFIEKTCNLILAPQNFARVIEILKAKVAETNKEKDLMLEQMGDAQDVK